jgi:hypothetical protein
MSRRKRLFLALLGLTLLTLSLALLAYALWPGETALQRVPLPSLPRVPPDAWLLPGGVA